MENTEKTKTWNFYSKLGINSVTKTEAFEALKQHIDENPDCVFCIGHDDIDFNKPGSEHWIYLDTGLTHKRWSERTEIGDDNLVEFLNYMNFNKGE